MMHPAFQQLVLETYAAAYLAALETEDFGLDMRRVLRDSEVAALLAEQAPTPTRRAARQAAEQRLARLPMEAA